MTRLFFVRHGESNTTVSRRIGGFRTCSGLSSLGRTQSERLRDRWLANPEVVADALISSQFPRALETAEIVAPALGGLPIEVVDGFGEHDPGEALDGVTFDEYIELHGPHDWETDPSTAGFPGGESLTSFHLRVSETIDDTVRRYNGKNVVVFCHGGVVDAALRQALRAPPIGTFDIWTANTSITEFQLVLPGRWRMLRYNDHAHLADLDWETSKDIEPE